MKTNKQIREELENLVIMATCALEDFDAKQDIEVHLKDLIETGKEILGELKEDFSDDHHNDELNGN